MTLPTSIEYDNAAKALCGILLGGFQSGYAVFEVDRKTASGAQHVERHAVGVRDCDLWLEALDTARDKRLCVRVWPWIYDKGVRRGIGTSAHNTSRGTNLRATQKVVQIRWPSRPSPVLVDRFERELDGHVIKSTRQEYVGLIVLPSLVNIGDVKTMAEEVAASMGAYASTAPLAVAEGHGLGFLTDVARGKRLLLESSRRGAA